MDKPRAVWVTGWLDYTSAPANWDPNVDIVKSPLMPYIGRSFPIWKCPADHVTVKNTKGLKLPRVRSNSMSQVFDDGSWLPGPSWRVYRTMTSIVNPVKTWVLVDEHPDSINDPIGADVRRIRPPKRGGMRPTNLEKSQFCDFSEIRISPALQQLTKPFVGRLWLYSVLRKK